MKLPGAASCGQSATQRRAELDARIAELGHTASWPAIHADFYALTETEIEQDRKRFLLRSAPQPAAAPSRRPAGVALPPTVQAATAIQAVTAS